MWPNWRGEHVALIGTGPSLTVEQVEAIRRARCRVIAINDAGLPGGVAPWCDLWYAADLRFWSRYRERLTSAALRVCAQREALQHGLAHLYLDTKSGKRGAGFAISGGHSGFQALQIALASEATLITLHGYDCRPLGDRTNYFGRKPRELDTLSPYETWIAPYRTLDVEAGRVLNCTPGSLIDAFPRADEFLRFDAPAGVASGSR